MSRTKSFLGGAFFAYLHQGAVMVVGVWLTPFYLRQLGAHDYGIWLVGLQILTFLLLADLGVTAIIPRDVARIEGSPTDALARVCRLQELIGQSVKVVCLQTALVAVMAVALFVSRPGLPVELKDPLKLILMVFLLTYPLRAAGAVLQGLQDLTFLGRTRIWIWSAGTAVAILMLLSGAKFYALACGWCLQEVGINVLAFLRLRKLRPELCSLGTWKAAGSFQWHWLTRGLWMSVSQVALSVLTGADTIIIARFLGPIAVVAYACTAKLVNVLQNQPQILAGIALPGLSQLRHSDSRESILKVTTSLKQAMLLVAGAIFCVVLALNKQFVELWVGPRYFAGMTVTLLLLINFVGRLIDYTLGVVLFAFGYERQLAIRCVLDGLCSVVLASILVRPFGMAGVAAGFAAGCLAVAIPMDLTLLSRELEISVKDIFHSYSPYIWRFCLTGSIAAVIANRFETWNMMTIALAGTLVTIGYFALVMPFVRQTALAGYVTLMTRGFTSAIRTRVPGWTSNS